MAILSLGSQLGNRLTVENHEQFLVELVQKASAHGLRIKHCCDTHYQILSKLGKPLVNVWPTTGRYLHVTPPPGAKSKRGPVDDMISLALSINGKGVRS